MIQLTDVLFEWALTKLSYKYLCALESVLRINYIILRNNTYYMALYAQHKGHETKKRLIRLKS